MGNSLKSAKIHADEANRPSANLSVASTLKYGTFAAAPEHAEGSTPSAPSIQCLICLESVNTRYLTCTLGHAICDTCFNTYVETECININEDNTAFRANNGAVLCPCGPEAGTHRHLPAFTMHALCTHLTEAIFEQYQNERLKLIQFIENENRIRAVAKEVSRISREFKSNIARPSQLSTETIAKMEADQLRILFPNAYMCPQCQFGPLDFSNCNSLKQHHNQPSSGGGGGKYNNSCPHCHFFADSITEWRKWDGALPQSRLAAIKTENTGAQNKQDSLEKLLSEAEKKQDELLAALDMKEQPKSRKTGENIGKSIASFFRGIGKSIASFFRGTKAGLVHTATTSEAESGYVAGCSNTGKVLGCLAASVVPLSRGIKEGFLRTANVDDNEDSPFSWSGYVAGCSNTGKVLGCLAASVVPLSRGIKEGFLRIANVDDNEDSPFSLFRSFCSVVGIGIGALIAGGLVLLVKVVEGIAIVIAMAMGS